MKPLTTVEAFCLNNAAHFVAARGRAPRDCTRQQFATLSPAASLASHNRRSIAMTCARTALRSASSQRSNSGVTGGLSQAGARLILVYVRPKKADKRFARGIATATQRQAGQERQPFPCAITEGHALPFQHQRAELPDRDPRLNQMVVA